MTTARARRDAGREAARRSPGSAGAGAVEWRFWLAQCCCALLAIALRAWHLDHGLPDFSEEAFPLRHALELWSRSPGQWDLNPHWFAYPSLSVYLHALVQLVHSTSKGLAAPADFVLWATTAPRELVLSARWISVCADAITVVLVGRCLRPHGMAAALLGMLITACAAPLITSSRLIYADSLLAMFCVAAVGAMQAAVVRGSRGWLVVSAVMSGLAVGTKYPGALLFVPLAVVAVSRPPRVRRLGLVVAVVVLVFLATTPYVLVSWPEFIRDTIQMSETTTSGTLGHVSGASLGYYGRLVMWALGVPALGLAVAGLFWVVRRRSSLESWIPWIAFVCLFGPVAATPVEAERYALPSVAIAAILVGNGFGLVKTQLGTTGKRWIAIALACLCLVQPIRAGALAAASGGATTTQEALRWCTEHLRPDDLILSEAYGPALLSARQKAQMTASQTFQLASADAQANYLRLPSHHVVWLPLLVGGRMRVPLGPEAQPTDVYPHAVDWNAATYDVRLLEGVQYLILTSPVRSRFAADTARFARQARFYEQVESWADTVIRFEPNDRVSGPTIEILRLGSTVQAQLARMGPLDSLWWASPVPAAFREQAERASPVRTTRADGELPVWVLAMRPAYRQHYEPFVLMLAEGHLEKGAAHSAKSLCDGVLRVDPENLDAARMFVQACFTSRDWQGAPARLQAVREAMQLVGAGSPDLELAYAEALIRTGGQRSAHSVLDSLARHGDEQTKRMAAAMRTRAE